MKLSIYCIFIGMCLSNINAHAQVYYNKLIKNREIFSINDTLRGKLLPERECYDIGFYELSINLDIYNKSINGCNKIVFKPNKPFQRIQLDLFSEFVVDSVLYNSKSLTIERFNNVFWVNFHEMIANTGTLEVYYHGKPRVAVKPPWDGGFVWSKDKEGNDWVGVACEGLGASAWWPLKDHLSDEPDSMRIKVTVPIHLQCISNGQLISVLNNENQTHTFEWFVSYPINSYNVTLNVGNYAHFYDTYNSMNGQPLQLDYYVLKSNVEVAKKHFQQVKPMLACFEKYFGSYPYPRDGYALVETSYWGMEHQGAIAYGNNYINNEYNFDFIIIHESGHEWFGNHITARDHAELWIHESFTTYTEAIYVEHTLGYQSALKYLKKQKERIKNLDPMLGTLDVNFNNWKSSDIYYKGTWMLHTLRNIVQDDKLWFQSLRGLYDAFPYPHIVGTDDIINYFSKSLGFDCNLFFAAYLSCKEPPTLEYKIQRNKSNNNYEFNYRWRQPEILAPFIMPIDVNINKHKKRIYPTTQWQNLKLESENDLEFLEDLFYIQAIKVD